MFLKISHYKYQLIPTLFTIPTFILLMGLGFWQLERLSEKRHKIQELQDKSTQPAIQLPQQFSDITKFRYRKVKVSGEYIHDKEIFLYAGTGPNGHTSGFLLFTPLKTTDNRLILVNRGWIPTSLKSQAERVFSLEEGTVEVTGYVMLGEENSWIIPENNDKKNIWFNINLAEMQKFIGANIENYYIMRVYEGDDFPIGNNLNVNLRNNHLEYAITWFMAAFTLITIFFLYHMKDNGRKND